MPTLGDGRALLLGEVVDREGVRRDIAERYGEESLYEGGLLIRSTLDPKMQAMARKALVDGLVRFDEARGWRGAQQKIDLTGREWGLALGEVRCAMVLSEGPRRNTSVTPDFVRLHDDKNTFTGKACSFHYPPQITYILCVTH